MRRIPFLVSVIFPYILPKFCRIYLTYVRYDFDAYSPQYIVAKTAKKVIIFTHRFNYIYINSKLFSERELWTYDRSLQYQ